MTISATPLSLRQWVKWPRTSAGSRKCREPSSLMVVTKSRTGACRLAAAARDGEEDGGGGGFWCARMAGRGRGRWGGGGGRKRRRGKSEDFGLRSWGGG